MNTRIVEAGELRPGQRRRWSRASKPANNIIPKHPVSTSANGIDGNLSYIWPLVVDGFLIAALLAVLRNSLLGEHSVYQWALVVIFTVLSLAFNVAHVPDNLLAQLIGAVPPLAL